MIAPRAEKESRIILLCQGGAGDVIAHTPMIRYFRKKYPNDEIMVTSTYSQLLEHNPNIDTLIPLKDPKDFYAEHVYKKNIRFFKKHFVYDAIMDEAAVGCKCLPEFICKLYGAEYDGGPLDYFITSYEKRIASTFLGQYKSFNKPIVLLHCTGAIPSDGNFNKTNVLKDLNINTVAQVVEKHKEQFLFVHIGLEGEPKVTGAIDALGMPMRETIALIPESDSYIFIESLFAHCSNATGAHGIVVFQNTSSEFFGYPNNHNISYSGGCPDFPCNRPVGALMDLLPGYRNPKTRQPLLWECPDQVCAKMPAEDISKVLVESIEEAKKRKEQASTTRGNPELDAVRKAPPPEATYKKPTENIPQGAVMAGDTNTALVAQPEVATVNEEPTTVPNRSIPSYRPRED